MSSAETARSGFGALDATVEVEEDQELAAAPAGDRQAEIVRARSAVEYHRRELATLEENLARGNAGRDELVAALDAKVGEQERMVAAARDDLRNAEAALAALEG